MLAVTAALTSFPSFFFGSLFLLFRELVKGDNKERIKIRTHRPKRAHPRELMYAPRKLFLNRRLSSFLANGCWNSVKIPYYRSGCSSRRITEDEHWPRISKLFWEFFLIPFLSIPLFFFFELFSLFPAILCLSVRCYVILSTR